MSRQSRRRPGHICGPTRARMLGHRPATASLSPELWTRTLLAKDVSNELTRSWSASLGGGRKSIEQEWLAGTQVPCPRKGELFESARISP